MLKSGELGNLRERVNHEVQQLILLLHIIWLNKYKLYYFYYFFTII